MKVGDVVWFQAYKDNMPIQGRIKQIGTQIELGCGWDKTDTRTFYALETIKDGYKFVFTRTTAQWLSTTIQTIEHADVDQEDMDYWDKRRRNIELNAMNNQSPLDSEIHQSY